MSLPAPNNTVGDTRKYEVFTTKAVTRKNDTGEVTRSTTYDQTLQLWSHSKAAPRSTRISISDAGICWRPATDWHRMIDLYTYTPGVNVVNEGSETTTYTGVSLPGVNDIRDNGGPGWSPIPNFDSDEHKRAIVECLNKLGDGKAQLGQFIAEARSSAEMLADTGTQLLRMLLAVKRGQIGQIPRDFKTYRDLAGNSLLQWNYGWKPLCSDLHSMYEDLMGKTKPVSLFVNAKRTVKTPLSQKIVRNTGLVIEVNGAVHDQVKLWATPNARFLYEANRYGLTNPLSLGWELVPYSFVLDWFMPIGATLQALTATAGLDFVGGYHSQKMEGTVEFSGGAGRALRNYHYFVRKAYGGFPDTRFFAMRNPLNLNKGANLVALLNQLF